MIWPSDFLKKYLQIKKNEMNPSANLFLRPGTSQRGWNDHRGQKGSRRTNQKEVGFLDIN